MANKGRDGDGVDSISSLPDEILQHILSSLKTATAIKTSTLSKRWRHVWSGTPSLYLVWSGHNFKVDSMNKTLARYTARKMTSFHLYADSINRSIESPDINRSIEFAMSKNVENMLLDIRYYRYNLPELLYFSSTIKQLTLSVHNYYSDMKVPISSVSWTSLKKLSLFCCNFSEECMARILSGSPILERLSLDFCSELKVIDVSKSLSLRTLEATIRATGMQIVAPHIRCLRLRSCVYLCTLVDVSSLTEANLEISVMSTEILTDGFPQVIMQKMVEKLQNVETFTFGPNLLKILSVAELYHLPFPSFKVKDLTLETAISQDAIPGLVTVLENSPQLKKLTVQPKLVNGTLLFGDMLNSIRRQLQSFRLWSIAFVRKEGNLCVDAIALSVTRDHRYQSYIARAGPSWLNQLITAEAAAATNPDNSFEMQGSRELDMISRVVKGTPCNNNASIAKSVVEYMTAAGAIPIAHNSAGPKMDIVLEEDGQRTGFLAETVEEYAEAILDIVKMKETERLKMAAYARK
ncbi:hypothetical protein Bca101_002296 [Brassica carinata]